MAEDRICDCGHLDDEVLAVETVTFTWDSVPYELDLCEPHLVEFERFEAEADRWRLQGRAIGRSTPPVRQVIGRIRKREENQAIRDWAKENDIQVGATIPDGLRRRFKETDAYRRWNAIAAE